MTWQTVRVPGSASEALDALDHAYEEWRIGVLGASDEFLASRSQAPPGTLDAEFPFAHVVLHVNREVIHHGSEIALLRISICVEGRVRERWRFDPRAETRAGKANLPIGSLLASGYGC